MKFVWLIIGFIIGHATMAFRISHWLDNHQDNVNDDEQSLYEQSVRHYNEQWANYIGHRCN